MDTRPHAHAARPDAPPGGQRGGWQDGQPDGEPDPDAVAAAVTRCRTVAGLSAGPFGAVATYLPGRRVLGVRIGQTLAVHVVARYGPTITEVGAEIEAAVAPLAAGRPIEIVVEDLATETEQPG